MPDMTRAEAIEFLRQGMRKSAVVENYTINGQTTTFRSLDEQRRELGRLLDEDAAASGTSRSRLAATRKGV